jgi:hypothetical protein
MKTPGEWFRLQLQTTAEGIIWAIRQLEPDLHLHLPPDPGYMGSWPAARHLWHVARYERLFALPAMKVWLGEPLAHVDMWRVEDRDWAIEQTRGTEAFIEDLRIIRAEQIALLNQFSDSDWERIEQTYWGERPLSMVLTKTYQHTLEHTDAILRMALWW